MSNTFVFMRCIVCRLWFKREVLRIDRPDGRRVLKFDGAFGPEGCGITLRAMLMKSALRINLSASYGKITILVISRYAAPPYPAAPDFLHGKACHTILRSLCSLTNRVSLPPHPGDRINRSMLSCRDMAPWLSTHSPTAPRGEGGGASHQRGGCISSSGARLACFPRPKPGCEGFIIRGRLL